MEAVGAAPSSDDEQPYPWTRPTRYALLAGLLAALSAAPPLLHGAGFGGAGLSALGLGAFGSWPALLAAAAAAALAGLPVRLFAHRLAPWTMRGGPDEGAGLLAKPPLLAVPMMLFGATAEEVAFRLMMFPMAAGWLLPHLPLAAALAAAAFLSSLIFALAHRYGAVWTRVVGGLIYSGAFLLSGTLVFPVAIHFFFNLSLYLNNRYRR